MKVYLSEYAQSPISPVCSDDCHFPALPLGVVNRHAPATTLALPLSQLW